MEEIDRKHTDTVSLPLIEAICCGSKKDLLFIVNSFFIYPVFLHDD